MRGFNTFIPDKHFQEIHHALGCPWPDEILGETYRNYFSIGEDCETADRMRASPHWTNGRQVFGSMCFHVTNEGRVALRHFLLENVHIPARYAVIYKGHGAGEYKPSIHAAKSRSAARYAAYLSSESEWPLVEYMAEIASVRIHSREHNPHLAR